MCGVAGGFSPKAEEGVKALSHRGPDAEGVAREGDLVLGHTRLSIIDLDPRSDQPFRRGGELPASQIQPSTSTGDPG